MEISEEEYQSESMMLSPKTTDELPILVTQQIDEKPSKVFCKICLSGNSNEQLLQPCTCKGSIGHVHLSCLERWLNECGVGMCELCQFQFNVDRTLRYTAWRSLWIWIRCPNHQSALCADFMVMIIMTLVISILVTSMIWGYQILPNDTTTIAKETDVNISYVLALFILIAVIGYIFSMYMIIKINIQPWYRWWINCIDIRLNREQFSLERIL